MGAVVASKSLRGHVQADASYQERLIRFIENHEVESPATHRILVGSER